MVNKDKVIKNRFGHSRLTIDPTCKKQVNEIFKSKAQKEREKDFIRDAAIISGLIALAVIMVAIDFLSNS